MRSCGNKTYKAEKSKEEGYAVATFDDLRRVFNGPKIIDITIDKSSPTVLYNMTFNSFKSRHYMLRKNARGIISTTERRGIERIPKIKRKKAMHFLKYLLSFLLEYFIITNIRFLELFEHEIQINI